MDERPFVGATFSIRLVAAPGSSICNSVCGRSKKLKSFGFAPDQSWGWEEFMRYEELADGWACSNGALYFIVCVALLPDDQPSPASTPARA